MLTVQFPPPSKTKTQDLSHPHWPADATANDTLAAPNFTRWYSPCGCPRGAFPDHCRLAANTKRGQKKHSIAGDGPAHPSEERRCQGSRGSTEQEPTRVAESWGLRHQRRSIISETLRQPAAEVSETTARVYFATGSQVRFASMVGHLLYIIKAMSQ